MYYCATCPNGPLTWPVRSMTPVRIEPVDGSVLFNLQFQHPELGEGVGRGFFRVEPSDDPALLHYTYRLSITFPLPEWCHRC